MVFDFTANTLDQAMAACLEAVGPKRLLFGSDLPIVKMRMYRTTENGFYYNHVPRGLYGDVSGDPHMVETDEKNITNFLYEELLAFKRAQRRSGLPPVKLRTFCAATRKRYLAFFKIVKEAACHAEN